MSAITHNFTIEQGASLTVTFVWKAGNAVPVDLSGYTARMQMRHTKASDEIQAELTTENGGIVLGGATGVISLIFSDEITASITRNGVYDVVLYEGANAHRFAEGAITLSKGVTRND